MLMMAGADVNIVYPEKSHQKKTDKDSETENEYRCTILINYMRNNHHKIDVMKTSFTYLIDKGAKLDVYDSLGLDAMVYAVKCNQIEFV
jgi:hypothetical protein